MKKILIIGGTGTISTPITEMLAGDKAYQVYVLNRGRNNKQLPHNITWIKGDVQAVEELEVALADMSFDSVINFIVWNEEDARKNIELFKNRTKQFIYISTVCVLNHEIDCNIDELSAYGNAYSGYGQAKAAAEQVFLQAKEVFDFPVTIVRPTQTYSDHRIPLSVKGKGCWSVVSRMRRGKEVIIHGDGQSVWASTHAQDFARGFAGIAANEKTVGETYQIMNNEPHTWDMIYQSLAELLQVEYKPVYIGTDLLKCSKSYNLMESIQGDKRWSNIFDISKIEKVSPGFKCKISYKQGLKMYLEYMDEHPELKIEEPEFDEWCDRVIAEYKKAVAGFVDNI